MKYLLDVNMLLAGIVESHPDHVKASAWLGAKRDVVTCPISEIGFIRISTNARAYGFSMRLARESLAAFSRSYKAGFIPADLPALESKPNGSAAVTDIYLAELAGRRSMKLATLDTTIDHPASEVIS